MAGNYHTAKTLEKGTSQFGLTFSATTYTFKDTTTDASGATVKTDVSVAIPNILPEITYHVGVSDNVEAGGRIAIGSLGGEFDVKWRLLHQDKLHLAIAPAIAYQAFILVEGGALKLPAILTYELADNFDLTVAAFATETHFKTVSDSASFDAFNGTLTSTGAALGFDLHGETMSIRPAVELSRYVFATGNKDFEPFNTVSFMVHLAWTGGREKKQLDRLERKIDNLQPQPYPPQPYPPQPYPPQPYAPQGGPSYAPPPSAPPPSAPGSPTE